MAGGLFFDPALVKLLLFVITNSHEENFAAVRCLLQISFAVDLHEGVFRAFIYFQFQQDGWFVCFFWIKDIVTIAFAGFFFPFDAVVLSGI